MNLGPNTVSLTYQYVLNQSGNNPITLGSGQPVNWDAAGVVMTSGDQQIEGSKNFTSYIKFQNLYTDENQDLYVGPDSYNNYFGGFASYNYFGGGSYNYFGKDGFTNNFGNGCPNNEFACFTASSTIQNLFSIQSGTEGGMIVNEFGGILFGLTNENDSQITNRFGILAKENYFGYNSYYGTSVSDTLNYFGGNSHGNYFGENTISGNYFGRSSNNYFGNTQSNNYFGGSGSTNYFYGGQFLNETRLLLAQFAGARSQSGQLGEMRISGSGLYICTGATGGWGRTFLSTF